MEKLFPAPRENPEEIYVLNISFHYAERVTEKEREKERESDRESMEKMKN